MKIGVIGLGSMGKRRIRLFKDNFPEITIIGIDSRKDRQKEVQEEFELKTFSSFEDALVSGIEAICICTSPISHEEIILKALASKIHVFTEINLLNNYYDTAIELANKSNCQLYLSSTFLHRREVQYFYDSVNNNSQVTYQYHVGQYLPDWHPWESYKEFFVANKKTNGCREIFAIELPWLTHVFGEVKDFSVQKQKLSTLEIDYPDTYAILLKHKNGIIGTLNVNVLSKVAKRDLTIMGDRTQISWDGTPSGLLKWDEQTKVMIKHNVYNSYMNNSNYSKTIIEDAYLEEVKEFISLLNGDIEKPIYSFEKDKIIIDLIQQFEGEI